MKILLLFSLLPLQNFAQDVTGLWAGYIYTSGNQLPYELVISETNNKLSGYSLTVFTIEGIENIGIKSMKVKMKKGDISIEDDELIYNNYTTQGKRVTLYCTLSLRMEDSIKILDGTFFTRALDRSSFKGTIHLQKVNSFSATRLIAQLDKMNLLSSVSFIQPKVVEKSNEPASPDVTGIELLPDNPVMEKEEAKIAATRAERIFQPATLPWQTKEIPNSSIPRVVKAIPTIVSSLVAAELASRKTEILRNVFFQSDSLILSLYDNGEIDGDTVSVVVNDKIIIAKKGLSTTAISTTLYITPESGDSLRLIMYAENLGKIPPNTGVLIIQDGNDRYQIRFEGDFQKNSAIILRRKR